MPSTLSTHEFCITQWLPDNTVVVVVASAPYVVGTGGTNVVHHLRDKDLEPCSMALC